MELPYYGTPLLNQWQNESVFFIKGGLPLFFDFFEKDGENSGLSIRVVLGLRKIGGGCRWIFQKVDVDGFFKTLCMVKNIKNAFFGKKSMSMGDGFQMWGVEPPPPPPPPPYPPHKTTMVPNRRKLPDYTNFQAK